MPGADMCLAQPVAEFHRYVRPSEHSTLSAFCTELTGIEQKQVDAAAPLQEVLAAFVEWVGTSSLWKSDGDIAIVTCGDWDLNIGIRIEATRKGFVDQVPPWMQRWVNIKQSWMKATGNTRATGMAGMLRDLGIELVGKHHSGIDDARNIARIVTKLLEGGAVVEGTGQWPGGRRSWAAKKEAKDKLKKDKEQAGTQASRQLTPGDAETSLKTSEESAATAARALVDLDST